VTTAVRADEGPMEDYLASIGIKASPDIEIDSAALMFYATQHMNKQFFGSFIRSQVTKVGHDPVAVFFRTEDGFASHTFQLSPAMISSDLLPDDFVYDFHTADARFLAEIIDGRDAEALIKVVEEPIGDIAVINLDAGGGQEQRYGDFPVSPENCAKAGLKWCNRESDLPYFDWAFRQRFTVECGDETASLPDSDLDEFRTVDEILEHFEEGIVETTRRIRFYSGAFR